MLKCIQKAGIDKLFQLVSSPGTAQHRLKTEKQQANRKNPTSEVTLSSSTCRAENGLPDAAVRKAPKETFLLLASI